MSGLSAPPSRAVPATPVAATARQGAGELNRPITMADVQDALPLLNNGRSGALQGWSAQFLRYLYKEQRCEDGSVSKHFVPLPALAAVFDAAFRQGVLPAAVKSSLATSVFKKGDRLDPGNYRPNAVGEPLCWLCAAILNKRIVGWAEDKGIRAPRQAGFRPRMSIEQQLFALRHFVDRSKFQKQPLFAAFVDLKKAYDSVQHDLLWASLERRGLHGSMLAAIQSLYDGGTMRMKISGKAGASGTARVGVRQGCPLSPTLFGIFFDDLHARLLADCPTAGLDCQGLSVPALFHADDVVLLSGTASGLQQLLDSMQGFCVANGLTISIAKTEVVVFGGGHHACVWTVARQQLQRSQTFTYLSMLLHEDRYIKHAIKQRQARALASLGSIFSRYRHLECANSVQLLIRLHQAILQPCASYACEVWAPAAAAAGPLKELQQLQLSFLRRACWVGKSVQVDVLFEEFRVVCWHDFWWRRVLQLWTALATAGLASIRNHVFCDSLALAAGGCNYNWTAQVSTYLQQNDVHVPIVGGEPVPVGTFQLQQAFAHQRQAHMQSLSLDPRSAPSASAKL